MPKAMKDELNAYNSITKQKEKFGVFRKTCLHIHTPESYDYKFLKSWDHKRYSLATDQEIYDICIEKKVFPNIFLIDSFLADGLFKTYASRKEVLSFLLLAHQLIINEIELAIVSDHHTIEGVSKLKLAIKYLCENKKGIIYPEVILGVEISCADKNHVVGFFEDSKSTRENINKWLGENLLSIEEGSFETSREVLKYINSIGGISYIAYIDQKDVFKENFLSGAYKTKLFSENTLDIIGLSNPDKKSYIEGKIKSYRSNNIKILYDNDAHDIDSLDYNCFWIKGSKRNFFMIKEALVDYDITINLMQNLSEKQYIKGIYIENSSDGFLTGKQGDGFCLNFSDALNCLIGGRGTGKSSVLEILEYVLSQKCTSEKLLDFICSHGNTWILYVYQGEEYLIEMRMPWKINKDNNILKFFGQNQSDRYNYKYFFNQYNVEEYAFKNYLSIFKVSFKFDELWINPVYNKKEMLNKFFDTHYSVNELVNTASGEKINQFLYEVLFKNKTLAKPSDSIKIRSKSGLKIMLSNVRYLLQQRKDNVNAVIEPFNENQVNILRIIYKQDEVAHEPPLDEWMFERNYNEQKYYKNYNITQGNLIQFLLSLYDEIGIFSFIEMIIEEDINLAVEKVNFLNYCTEMTTGLVDVGINEVKTDEVFKIVRIIFNELITDSNIQIIIGYLKEYVQEIEEFSLEFNLNNKEGTIKQNPLYRDVRKLSLGQKVVAMLSFVLGYSEYSKDYRPLIIDQPEDNLDNQYIYKNLVKQLRSVKDKRQVIIATHNATIVTNAKAEQVCIMTSDNQHGWVETTGYPVETRIKKNIINYLEGGKESFLHKLNVYEEALGICITNKDSL